MLSAQIGAVHCAGGYLFRALPLCAGRSCVLRQTAGREDAYTGVSDEINRGADGICTIHRTIL